MYGSINFWPSLLPQTTNWIPQVKPSPSHLLCPLKKDLLPPLKQPQIPCACQLYICLLLCSHCNLGVLQLKKLSNPLNMLIARLKNHVLSQPWHSSWSNNILALTLQTTTWRALRAWPGTLHLLYVSHLIWIIFSYEAQTLAVALTLVLQVTEPNLL